MCACVTFSSNVPRVLVISVVNASASGRYVCLWVLLLLLLNVRVFFFSELSSLIAAKMMGVVEFIYHLRRDEVFSWLIVSLVVLLGSFMSQISLPLLPNVSFLWARVVSNLSPHFTYILFLRDSR